MPSRHHSIRAREYGEVVLHPHHGLLIEVTIEVVMLAASLMFVFGSLCFFGGEPFQVLEIGELLFIVASLIYVGVGMLEMYELCVANGGNVWVDSTFHEQMTYLVSATIFMFGTILFWPNIYRNHPEWKDRGEAVAAWCFVIGSSGFVIASFWNALSLADTAEEDAEGGGKAWTRITNAALFFSLMGGMFFVTGSYLYTLDMEEGCSAYSPQPASDAGDTSTKTESGSWCVGVTDQGTILYFIGSCMYLMQSILNCIKLAMRKCINAETGYCEVQMHGDESESERILFDPEEQAAE